MAKGLMELLIFYLTKDNYPSWNIKMKEYQDEGFTDLSRH